MVTAPTTASEHNGPGRAYLVANGIDRSTAIALRRQHDGAIVSRNADGTYRVTRSR